jgi:hypothetical protein
MIFFPLTHLNAPRFYDLFEGENKTAVRSGKHLLKTVLVILMVVAVFLKK